MRKLLIDVKSAVGTAPKTEDREYEDKHKAIKDIDAAIIEFTRAVDKMRAVAKAVSQALDSVAKAYSVLSADKETSESVKELAKTCEDAMRNIRSDDLEAYIKDLEHDDTAPTLVFKTKVADLRKAEGFRSKAMSEYDTYRELVRQKEKEYDKKGKSLTGSKNYDDDVKKRDDLQTKYDDLNRKYKEEADALIAARLETYLAAMKRFGASTAKFFSAIQVNLSKVDSAAQSAIA